MAIAAKTITDKYALYNADCMSVLPSLRAESVGFSIYSPPFPELYQYSNDPRDMSNVQTFEEGMEQYAYVIREVHRLTMPGRLTAVHCADLKKGQHLRDFPGAIIQAHESAGWHFACRIVIRKDPWLVARRTRLRNLMHKTIVQDSAKSRTAGPDYLVVMVKGGENQEPIKHPDGLSHYIGEKLPPADLVRRFTNFSGDQRKNLLSHWIWRRYADNVWDDIRTGRLLDFKKARETEEEKHVCPLQLDVIDRALLLWSNPGDVVLTPFLGIGSEVYAAVCAGRKGIGCDLKESYYRQAVEHVATAGTPRAAQAEISEILGGGPGESLGDEDEDELEEERADD